MDKTTVTTLVLFPLFTVIQ